MQACTPRSFLHAKRLGKQYNVDPLDIVVELGRRKAVAGQEDWILDVTLDLVNRQKHDVRSVRLQPDLPESVGKA